MQPVYTKHGYENHYIFLDYEAEQETGVHNPNLVVAQYFDGTTFHFRTNDDFCKWLISKHHKGYTAIAHNAKGYDSQFIIKYCVENTLKPYTIYNGTKLMYLKVANIKIIDSHSFVASPLSAFPKTFGFNELKKGYFPHFFNTNENQNYVGPIPDIKYYGADTMSKPTREAFMKWYVEKFKENYVFDFQKEFVEYCISDANILRKGCIELRKQFLEIADVDPFQYITIASVCMAIYRSGFIADAKRVEWIDEDEVEQDEVNDGLGLYVHHNKIAFVKDDRKEMYSKNSITWLNTFPNVHNALNGGEVTICGYKVDGFNQETNTVFQFHGSFWHGCPKCYNEDTINNINHETMGDLHEKTKERSKQIIYAGFNLTEIWEYEWVKSKGSVIKNSDHIVEPLNPRDAFYGGRKNANKLKVQNKKMLYIDVCSLYPTVQYFDNYPVGHPKKIHKPEKYDGNWYGLIKCKILAPQKLYHPVLPIRKEKLIFTLCTKCFDEKCDKCTHTDEERSLIGTWTTDEVSKALEKGYKIMEIYEVWHFKEKSNDLFKGYVKKFLKIKLETSPWDSNFETVQKYITAVKNSLGIILKI